MNRYDNHQRRRYGRAIGSTQILRRYESTPKYNPIPYQPPSEDAVTERALQLISLHASNDLISDETGLTLNEIKQLRK